MKKRPNKTIRSKHDSGIGRDKLPYWKLRQRVWLSVTRERIVQGCGLEGVADLDVCAKALGRRLQWLIDENKDNWLGIVERKEL